MLLEPYDVATLGFPIHMIREAMDMGPAFWYLFQQCPAIPRMLLVDYRLWPLETSL